MTLRESIDTRHEALVLEALDFAPSCLLEDCWDGHPAATHQVVMLACWCPPVPVCGGCASALEVAIAEQTPVEPSQCAACKQQLQGRHFGDWFRIEPLPW